MNIINFSYIAGFFDGEGCIQIVKKHKKKYISVFIGQSKDEILFIMKNFLAKYDIIGYIYTNKNESYSNGKYSSLQIRNQKSAYTFLNKIKDKVVVKKEEVENALSIKFKYDRNYISQEDRTEIARLKKEGKSYREISIIFKVHKDTIRKNYYKFKRATDLLASPTGQGQ